MAVVIFRHESVKYPLRVTRILDVATVAVAHSTEKVTKIFKKDFTSADLQPELEYVFSFFPVSTSLIFKGDEENSATRLSGIVVYFFTVGDATEFFQGRDGYDEDEVMAALKKFGRVYQKNIKNVDDPDGFLFFHVTEGDSAKGGFFIFEDFGKMIVGNFF